MTKKLVILGDSAFAQIACEYFTHDSDHEVVGFSVERAYRQQEQLFGRPVVPFEELERHFDPATHSFYAAITYSQLNRLRTRLYHAAKAKGFRPASYVSSRAFVWRNVELGEHCFIFEDNTVQPFVKVGANTVMWSGNHVGHHSTLGSNLFLSSHVVISGFCEIGDNCFLGVNATLVNNITIGRDCLVGAGTVVARSLPENALVKPVVSGHAPLARAYFKVEE